MSLKARGQTLLGPAVVEQLPARRFGRCVPSRQLPRFLKAL